MSSSSRNHRQFSKRTPSVAGKLVRWVALPGLGLGFAMWSASVVAGMYAAPVSTAASVLPAGKQARAVASTEVALAPVHKERIKPTKPIVASVGASREKLAKILSHEKTQPQVAALPALSSAKSTRHWSEVFPKPDGAFADASFDERFERVVARADLSRESLAAAFADSGMILPEAGHVQIARISPDTASPARERFGANSDAAAGQLLAYADPSPNAAAGALATLSAIPEDGISAEDPDEDTAVLPDYEDTPDASPLPGNRPKRGADAAKPQREDQPEADDRQQSGQQEIEQRKPTRAGLKAQQKLAYAKPDDAEEKSGLGQKFNNIFNRPKVGNGVAVYDISAAKVYMPDGSVLEAHSGIGKMADNPRYTHVKMNGPTPAHTYNLKMREKRFHGVEAIRMLPVDGKNKFGRDGFLTHSYLLRGGRAESHGCVAFKDYKRFLTAFKRGHVKQLVVVNSGGRAVAARGGKSNGTRVADNSTPEKFSETKSR